MLALQLITHLRSLASCVWSLRWTSDIDAIEGIVRDADDVFVPGRAGPGSRLQVTSAEYISLALTTLSLAYSALSFGYWNPASALSVIVRTGLVYYCSPGVCAPLHLAQSQDVTELSSIITPAVFTLRSASARDGRGCERNVHEALKLEGRNALYNIL